MAQQRAVGWIHPSRSLGLDLHFDRIVPIQLSVDASPNTGANGDGLAEAATGACLLYLDQDRAKPNRALQDALHIAEDGDDAWSSVVRRLHPAHTELFARSFEAYAKDPLRHPLHLEVAMGHPQEGWLWFRISAASSVDGSGRATETVVCFHPLTEHRALLRRAEAAEARARSLKAELEARKTPKPPPPGPKPPPLQNRPVDLPRQSIKEALDRAESAASAWTDPPDVGSTLRALLEDVERLLSKERCRDDQVFESIESVLEEVSLVALNAQLEALRLGEKGTGLAAVAAHLKQLAKGCSTLSRSLHTENASLKARDKEHTERAQLLRQRLKALLQDSSPPRSVAHRAQLRSALSELKLILTQAI